MIEQNLKITYAQIEEYSADLLTYLGSLNCVQAKAYVLPRVLQEDTYTTIERIEPQYFDDFIAETKIRRSFVDYYGDAHVSTKCPLKLPGVIQYVGDHHEVNNLVKKLNDAKTTFERYVLSIGDENAQFHMVHGIFPYLILQQLTRHIHTLIPIPKSVGFSLANKQLSDKYTVEKAEGLLERNFLQPCDLIPMKEWQSIIEDGLAKLKNLPPEHNIVRRRNGKVQPIANVSYDFGAKQMVASLPLIFVSDVTSPIKINDMKPYDTNERRFHLRPTKKIKTIEINKWLNLHAVPIKKVLKKT
jgi:DNA replication terminus site-binding protein